MNLRTRRGVGFEPRRRSVRLPVPPANRSLDRDESLLALLHALARVANEARSLEEASQASLDRICSWVKWPVGHLYRVEGSSPAELVPTKVWHLDDGRQFEAFRRATAGIRITHGIGLPGTVWSGAAPAWIVDVRDDANFPRASAARAAGIRAAFAFPILANAEVVAVLEFFSVDALEPDESFLGILDHVGRDLGRVAERERAEEEIRASRERLRAVLEHAPIALFATDRKGLFTLSEGKGLEAAGLKAGELVGRSATELYGSVSVTSSTGETLGGADVIARALGGHGIFFRGEAHGRWFEQRLAPHRDRKGDVDGLVGVAIDVTERKRAEDALRESLARFELAVLGTHDGLYDATVQPGNAWRSPDTGIYYSPRFREVLGFEEHEFPSVLGTWMSLLHPDDYDRVLEQVRRHVEERAPFDTEYRLRTKSGEYRWFNARGQAVWDASGNVLRMAGSLRDVTERKRMEEELRKSEERFRKVFEESLTTAAINARSDGRYIEVNQEFLRATGFTREELIGRTARELGLWADADGPRAIARELALHGAVHKLPMKFRRKDGAIRSGRFSAYPMEVAGEECVVAFGEDVTEQERLEELRAELATRLVEAQENERRRIARELHDEIGQLLTGVKLALEAAVRTPKGAVRQASRALPVVASLLERVRDLSLDLRPPMLDELGLLPALWWLFEHRAGRALVQVRFEHSGVTRRFPPELEIAAYRIVQEALTNVARHAGVNEATVKLDARGDRLTIEVEDRGRGFEAGKDLSASSTGIAGMIERAASLGGHLDVESAPGTGTRLRAELPLTSEKDAR